MSPIEKDDSLPFKVPDRPAPRWDNLRHRLILTLIICSLLLPAGHLYAHIAEYCSCRDGRISNKAALAVSKCPAQPPACNIGTDWNPLTDEAYAELAVNRLSKAVQIPTESFDDVPLDASDPAFDKFSTFTHFLEVEFPKIFSDPIKHETVNTHGHLFTWQGSNPDLQPILLMAHMDVVPVLPATLDQWTYPPFEGKIVVDATPLTPGTWIWGRGSSDCKQHLMGIYGALERLVSEGFEPERTIILANGFDEEVSRPHLIQPFTDLWRP